MATSPPLPANLPADPWSPLAASRGGMPVAVRWTPTMWLHAVALSADDQSCEMLLGDGTTTRIPRTSIVAIPTGSPFQGSIHNAIRSLQGSRPTSSRNRPAGGGAQ